jgi:(p)ppGpp synthase/HD superfamily hydrolase
MQLTDRLTDALVLATRLHGQDRRKGKAIPYIAHLLSVCALVLEDGGSEDEAIAALLHDALEDHPESVTPALLEAQFGADVCSMVTDCSDTPDDYPGGEKPPWRERKLAYLTHLESASVAVCRVALADKLHNLRELLSDLKAEGDAVWGRFNAGPADQVWFYSEVAERIRVAGYSGRLLARYEEAVRELQQFKPEF